MKKYLTLYEINSLVRETIELTLNQQYWVEAELSELHEVRGHCYMELVQKDSRPKAEKNTPIARAQARCWHNVWAVVRPHFERVTGQPLRAGLSFMKPTASRGSLLTSTLHSRSATLQGVDKRLLRS